MGKTKIPANFSLERFIGVYVSKALEVASGDPTIDEFDERVRTSVSEGLGISKEVVMALHHSFHWAFFNSRESIFEYIQGTRNGDSACVRLRRKHTQEDTEFYCGFVLEKYGDYLRARISNIDALVNNFRRAA